MGVGIKVQQGRIFLQSRDLAQFFERVGNGREQFARPIALKSHVEFFETADEIEHFLAEIRTAGSFTEMGTAPKGAVGVDETAARFAIKHGANAIVFVREFSSAGRAVGFRGEQGFSFGQMWSKSGELKLTAFRTSDAVSLYRSLRKVRVNRPNRGENFWNWLLHDYF